MIVWTDTETTGLHPPEGNLLEVARERTVDLGPRPGRGAHARPRAPPVVYSTSPPTFFAQIWAGFS